MGGLGCLPGWRAVLDLMSSSGRRQAELRRGGSTTLQSCRMPAEVGSSKLLYVVKVWSEDGRSVDESGRPELMMMRGGSES